MLQPKSIGAADKSSFIVSQFRTSAKGSSSNVEQQVPKVPKARAQDNKTARMPRNELLDLIYECFRRHKYWPFKSLKAELKQPEVYLKQTLEEVAHLVKSGDFAMTWELKPEARESNYADAWAYRDAKEELPPTAGYNFDEGSEGEPTASAMGTDIDEDEANVPFESVV
jgi:transcription initiation factor TFIIF subunit beta